MARGLAGEHERAAGREHAVEFEHRALEVGNVVQHGMADDQVKALVGERQALRVGDLRRDVEAELRGVCGERLEHPGRDVAARRVADQALEHQVEREIAGARADLERALEPRGRRAERLLELRAHLLAADRAEVDTPLGVVVLGRDVVVGGVRLADLLRGQHGRHGLPPYTRPP